MLRSSCAWGRSRNPGAPGFVLWIQRSQFALLPGKVETARLPVARSSQATLDREGRERTRAAPRSRASAGLIQLRSASSCDAQGPRPDGKWACERKPRGGLVREPRRGKDPEAGGPHPPTASGARLSLATGPRQWDPTPVAGSRRGSRSVEWPSGRSARGRGRQRSSARISPFHSHTDLGRKDVQARQALIDHEDQRIIGEGQPIGFPVGRPLREAPDPAPQRDLEQRLFESTHCLHTSARGFVAVMA
jgi:hypothetical protein